jgi:hypothetical protein
MYKKAIQIISFILFLSIPSFLSAQNADEIIAKHIEAHGGEKKWEKVESIKITGEFTAFSETKDFLSIKTKSGQYYSNLHLGQYEVFEAFNGKEGWTIDPWQEIEYPRELNSDEVSVFLQKAEFFTPFFKYKEKGHAVEFIGKDNVDGVHVFVLKLTRKNGKAETWYLNSETYLEYKCESDWLDFARALPAESYFDDFRTVDGLVLPFYIERTFWQRDRVTQIENVEINTKVDDNIFVMPKSESFEKIAFIQGEWDVKSDVWTRRQTWYTLGNTTSSFEIAARNMIQEKIAYEFTFLQTEIRNLSYSESTGKYSLSIYNDFDFGTTVFEGQFADSVLILDNMKTGIGDAANQSPQKTQYSYTFISKDNFILEKKVSTDNGETWRPEVKFTYSGKL